VYETDQMSVRVADPAIITGAMARLRANPPAMLGGQPAAVVDLAAGSVELPPTDAVLINAQTSKVVVRPSGTEPKLKCYLEAHLPAARSVELVAARAEARSMVAAIRSEMSAALGLGTPSIEGLV
jgi:phosphomannomutase